MFSTLLLLLPFCCASDTDPIPGFVESISADRLMADVESLVSFGTRHSMSDTTSETRGVGAARRWLLAEMQAIADAPGSRLEANEQRFMANVRGKEVEMVNVFGYLPASSGDPQARTYVVSGHYDSRASNPMDFTSDAPGADDDASGTAVVIELARIFSTYEFDVNLVFLCADGEELGLFGSKHFCKTALEDGMLIDAMITNDIVGGTQGGNGVEDDLTVRCFSNAENGLHSPSRELARSLVDSAARYVTEAKIQLVLRTDRFGRGGDHIPFDKAGIPALRLTEANENYERQHQDVRVEDGQEYGDLPEFVSRISASSYLYIHPPPLLRRLTPSKRGSRRFFSPQRTASKPGSRASSPSPFCP